MPEKNATPAQVVALQDYIILICEVKQIIYMKEFVTEAIVMSLEHSGEWDANVNLLTKEIGRISARVIGGKRSLSKFAQHLNPLNIVLVRIVQKKAFTLTDVITKTRFLGTARSMQKSLAAMAVMNASIPLSSPDQRLWFYTSGALQDGEVSQNEILKILGSDPSRAVCGKCRKSGVKLFVPEDQIFLCEICGRKTGKNGIKLL